MKLYYAPTLHSYKACAVARYLDSPVEFVAVDLKAGEHRSPAFLAINPGARVPVLSEGGKSLWESNAIMMRLALLAGSDLWPQGVAQSDVLRWLSWDSEHFKPHAGAFYFEHIIRPAIGLGDPDPAALAAATPPFLASAKILDDHLSGRQFLLDDPLTIADFALAVTLPFAEQSAMPLDGFPSIRDWHARLEALPAWRAPFPQSAQAPAA